MTALLLCPSSSDRPQLLHAVQDAGHEASVVETAAQAVSVIAHEAVGLVIVDLAAGVEALRFIRKQRASHRGRTSIVCVADRRQPCSSAEALRLGVADIITRPVRRSDVAAAIANALEMKQLAARPAEAPPEPVDADDGVFSVSPAMRDVMGIARRVATSRCGVLIVGERGSGRATIAHAIHLHGREDGAPFVRITCSDVRTADLDEVLDGGTPPGSTVYLSDIGELPRAAQARLEDRLRTAVSGGRRPVRFIAGSQPRIAEWMDRGIVRRGLIEALGIVRIDLPPLRQRPQDIPLLATHFLKESCRQAEVPAKTYSRSALTLMSALPWPGNASELRSLADRLSVLVVGGVVRMEDVLANVRLGGAEAVGRQRESLRQARERFERDYIMGVLQHHHGRMGDAARDLGIERTNLYRKIRQLNIRWAPNP